MKFLSLPTALLIVILTLVPSVFAQSATLTATVTPNPLHVEVVAPSNVIVGEGFEIQVLVSNFGTTKVRSTSITINSPKNLKINGKKKGLGTIDPGKSKIATWKARLLSPGNYFIHADVSARLGKKSISTSDTSLVSSTESFLAFWFSFLFP
ncbi:hypothetical protein IID23_01120 [Patescibacteria group bacterium]|nr:hypothetical protein [Patescibacteria group bacterium]